jgi:hypothetical protein
LAATTCLKISKQKQFWIEFHPRRNVFTKNICYADPAVKKTGRKTHGISQLTLFICNIEIIVEFLGLLTPKSKRR